jgi:hypothetical protein
MRQIKEHLRILTAYAFAKNQKINQKFYQLQIMNWMCKEMDLEYEVKQLAKKVCRVVVVAVVVVSAAAVVVVVVVVVVVLVVLAAVVVFLLLVFLSHVPGSLC